VSATGNFLNVGKSLTGRRWRARLAQDRTALAIAERHGLPEILARVLAARGVGLEEAGSYMNPTLRDLMPQPDSVRDLEKGAARIARAVMQGETIGIIGDYDVDGMTSTALLLQFLRAAGAEPHVHIPHRVVEGYGPSVAAIEALKEAGCAVLVTLDCGVMAHDPLARAAHLGVETVVVDHHQAGEKLPEAHAVINPNRHDDTSGLGYLCAAGVAMLLVATIHRDLKEAGWWSDERPAPDILAWLDLVALGTVCDVVPLKGLNRAYVQQGLKVMGARRHVGLTALADAGRLNRKPDTHALGFVLGPRLNAAGRIGSAMLGLDLLTAADRGSANDLAQKLERLNRERQELELAILDHATRQAEAALGETASAPVIVVAGEGWHAGVLGLIAARLKERFNRPALAIGLSKDQPEAPGSGRSIPGADLGRAVAAAAEAGVIVKGGGHPMAAGLTIERARLADLRRFLEDHFASEVEAATADPVLDIDGALAASGVTMELIALLECAGPYGSGNPAPVFALPAHRVVYADSAGADHVRCTLAASDGTRINAIAFRALHTELGETLLSERKHPLHVAGRLSVNDWNGKRSAQLFIDDVAAAT
jgi:single-stranded-DNA-specific exonuclease